MNKINWTVRLRNKQFVISLVSAIILGIQGVAVALGYTYDFNALTNTLIGIINAVFAVSASLGVLQDPTTKGYGDSERAQSYERPQ